MNALTASKPGAQKSGIKYSLGQQTYQYYADPKSHSAMQKYVDRLSMQSS